MTPRSHFAAPRPADDASDAPLGEYSPSCSEKMSELAAWAAAMIRVLMTCEVLDVSGMCWVINLQSILVPTGSMTMLAFALFGSSSWTTLQVNSTHHLIHHNISQII